MLRMWMRIGLLSLGVLFVNGLYDARRVLEDDTIEGSFIAFAPNVGALDCLRLKGLVNKMQRMSVSTIDLSQIPRSYEFKMVNICFIGFEGDERLKAEVENLPEISIVYKDSVVRTTVKSWGLDRIDQEDLPLNKQDLDSSFTGKDISIYVLDTGINKDHTDFGDRAEFGNDFINEGFPQDGNGHGSHCAGTAAGSTYGIARDAKVIGVKVLSSSGEGSYESVIGGINWAVEDARGTESVISMSLGGPTSDPLDEAVNAAARSGMIVVVAAGNDNMNACYSSPARAGGDGANGGVISVGSSTIDDKKSYFSNYGKCVDIFAPGSDITSIWFGGKTSENTISGTSMATPHVAGVAALLLEKHKRNKALAQQELFDVAVRGKLSGLSSSTPNLLLQVPPSKKSSRWCVDGFVYNKKCYEYFNETQLSFDQAETFCSNKGGNLLTFASSIVKDGLDQYFSSSSCDDIWLGLKHENNKKFQWTSGAIFSGYTNWDLNEPDVTQDKTCFTFANCNNHKWNGFSCDLPKNFMCETPSPCDIVNEDNDKCIQLFHEETQVKSYQDANKFCVDVWGGNLVTFDSETVRKRIQNIVSFGNCKNEFWIGLNDIEKEGEYEWIGTKKKLGEFQTWAPNEPSSSQSDKDCVFSTCDQNPKWADSVCNIPKQFVCEKEHPSRTLSPTVSPTPKPTRGPIQATPCDFLSNENICYTYHKEKVSHSQAKSYCEKYNGFLVEMTNAEEEKNVIELFKYKNCEETRFWIGLNDKAIENRFVWDQSGEEASWTRWAPNEPNNAGILGEDCVQSSCPYKSQTYWNDVRCNEKSAFICQRRDPLKTNAPTPPTKAPTGMKICDHTFGNICYKYYETKMGLNDAQKFCFERNAKLLEVRNETIRDEIKIFWANIGGCQPIFMGLSDEENEGTYNWLSDGELALFTNWAQGEPNGGNKENCVEQLCDSNLGWNDVVCFEKLYPVVCESDLDATFSPTSSPVSTPTKLPEETTSPTVSPIDKDGTTSPTLSPIDKDGTSSPTVSPIDKDGTSSPTLSPIEDLQQTPSPNTKGEETTDESFLKTSPLLVIGITTPIAMFALLSGGFLFYKRRRKEQKAQDLFHHSALAPNI